MCIVQYEAACFGIKPGIDVGILAAALKEEGAAMPKRRIDELLQGLIASGKLFSDKLCRFWTSSHDMEIAKSCVDIDRPNSGDPRYVTNYVKNIFTFRRGLERDEQLRPGHTFLEDFQTDITPNMRSILVDWLVEVAEEYRLHRESLFTAVNYVDRCLGKCQIHRHKLQLLGCACMLLAAKFEEIYAPAVDEFVYISDNTYDHAEIVRMESKVCKILNFRMTVSTPVSFLGRFLMAAKADTDGCDSQLKKLPHLANYLVELALQDYNMLKFASSRVAAAAVSLARRTLNLSPTWTPTLAYYTEYEGDSLYPCEKALRRLQRSASTGELRAIHDKYGEERFLAVARIAPVTGSLNPQNSPGASHN
jgi:cyclin A